MRSAPLGLLTLLPEPISVALEKLGEDGSVVLLDVFDGALEVARQPRVVVGQATLGLAPGKPHEVQITSLLVLAQVAGIKPIGVEEERHIRDRGHQRSVRM